MIDYKNTIESNFDININEFTLIDSHFGTEIFLAVTTTGKFIVKKLPIHMKGVKNEGPVTSFLFSKGIRVAQLLKSINEEYVLIYNNNQFIVQEFIEGNTLGLNCAPDWFLKLSAKTLGKINNLLSDYTNLPVCFGNDFFNIENTTNKLNKYINEFNNIKQNCDLSIQKKWKEQILHLEKISCFNIDTSKLTYANSHGDYNISQIIVHNENIAIIDWSSACKLPVCLEIITSFVFASPKSFDGSIDTNDLNEYISYYLEYSPLSKYDLKMMPYVLYFWHCMCNYHPSEQIPENYRSTANLISNLLNWLHSNVEELLLSVMNRLTTASNG